jgi:hypothetical protein
MIRLNIHEAKTHLSRYLDRLAKGEKIMLCKRNVPITENRGDGQGFVGPMRTRHAIEPLPLEEEAVLMPPRLPELHRDIFDRMLVCQALTHQSP